MKNRYIIGLIGIVVGVGLFAAVIVRSKPVGGGSSMIELAFVSGNVLSDPQMLPGQNSSTKLNVKGNYTLRLNVDFNSLPPGTCYGEGEGTSDATLLRLVQSNTPRVGSIDTNGLDKINLPYTSIISWNTTIDGADYLVTLSDFGTRANPTITRTTTPDGKDLYLFRNGILRVFKGGPPIKSFERCTGILNFDMTAK